MQNLNILGSLCSCACRFGPNLVGNPEDRFSCDEAHIINVSMFPYRSVTMNDIVDMEVNGACGTEDEVYDNLWDKSELYSKVIAHVHIEQKMKYMTTYGINLSYTQR